jgi:hypothetical protein
MQDKYVPPIELLIYPTKDGTKDVLVTGRFERCRR